MKRSSLDNLLIEAFPDGTVYSVGGRVRDEVLGEIGCPQPSSPDSDYLVTGVAFDDMLQRLKKLGRTELVGASFGVLKFTTGGSSVDIALPRRERSSGHGHREFEVQSAPNVPVEDDLSRRDFRMNMMARRLIDEQLFDPFGGLEDLKHGRLDILKPDVFQEDPLRILRGAQFAARFNLAPTAITKRSMTAAAGLVPSVAAERIADEIVKLLTKADKPSIGFELLRQTGALTYVMPELLEGWDVEQNQFHRYSVYYHSLRCVDAAPKQTIIRLAALLHDIGKPRTKAGPHFYRHELVGEKMTRDLLARLRFSSEVTSQVAHLVRHHMFSSDDGITDAGVRRFISRVGKEALPALFALRKADVLASGLPERAPHALDRFEGRVATELSGPTAFGVTQLALSGADIIRIMRELGLVNAGFRGDARVGAMLRHLLEVVLDTPESNTSETLTRIVRAQLLQRKGLA